MGKKHKKHQLQSKAKVVANDVVPSVPLPPVRSKPTTLFWLFLVAIVLPIIEAVGIKVYQFALIYVHWGWYTPGWGGLKDVLINFKKQGNYLEFSPAWFSMIPMITIIVMIVVIIVYSRVSKNEFNRNQ